MMSTCKNGFPHQLGLEIVEYVDSRITTVLEKQESFSIWLDEILEQCNKSFTRAEPELLPKTPSAKRSRRRIQVEESQHEQDVEEPAKKRRSIAKKGRPRRKGKDDTETETEAEADDEGEAPVASPPRTTRRTRAATRSTASARTTRTTRARKKKTSTDSHEENVTAVPPKEDLRSKFRRKPSSTERTGGLSTIPQTPKTPVRVQIDTRFCTNSPRSAAGYMSVKERASQYEQTVLSSGGNTPTVKGPRVNGLCRQGSKVSQSNTLQTPSSGRVLTPSTPSTLTLKSNPKVSLSSHHTSSSSAKRLVPKRTCTAAPATPVNRNKTASRTNKRHSLKLLPSKTRRSSTLGLSRQLIPKEPAVAGDKKASKSDAGRSSGTSEGSKKSVESIPDQQKKSGELKNKLTLKKTRVLRPKATRSAVKQAQEEEKMEIQHVNSSEAEQVSDVSELSKSNEHRQGTITVEKARPVATALEKDGAEERRGTYTSDKTASSHCDVVMNSDTEGADDPTEPEKSGDSDISGKSPINDGDKNKSDASDHSIEADKRRTVTLSDSLKTARTPSLGDTGNRKSDSDKVVRNSNSSDQRKSSQTEQARTSATRLSRKSSEKARKAIQQEIMDEMPADTESLHPKRTTRSALRKASSVCSTASEAEDGSVRRSVRLKARVSEASKPDSVTETSAADCEEDAQVENNDVFTVPDAPASRNSRSLRKRQKSESDDTDSEAKRPKGDKSCSEGDSSKEESDRGNTTSESDCDIVDRSPSPADKVAPLHPLSFLNNLNKDKSSNLFNLNTTGVKSFLRSSPVKRPLSRKEQEVLRRRGLEEKQRKENERMEKRRQQLQAQAEAKKRQREEHWRKVQHLRMQKQKREQEVKDKLLEKMEHKNKIPEQVLEVKRKEKQEKKQIRQQKHTEAEERRLQEEAERLRKLKEKEEEDRQHAELLQRKREFEEQERLKRIAEEKQRQEEHQREAERKRKEEELRQIQIQQENERQKLKQQAEREREQRLRAEKTERERREHENQQKKDLEDEIRKLRELEKQRKIADHQRKEELRHMESRYKELMDQQKTVMNIMTSTIPVPNKAAMNTTLTLDKPSDSQAKSPKPYPMTPKQRIPSLQSYDISGLRSDESSDDECSPKSKIPSWSEGSALTVALVNQNYHPIDSAALFGPITLPDLNEMFAKKKPRFNKRTSSANWDSPLLKTSFHRK